MIAKTLYELLRFYARHDATASIVADVNGHRVEVDDIHWQPAHGVIILRLDRFLSIMALEEVQVPRPVGEDEHDEQGKQNEPGA